MAKRAVKNILIGCTFIMSFVALLNSTAPPQVIIQSPPTETEATGAEQKPKTIAPPKLLPNPTYTSTFTPLQTTEPEEKPTTETKKSSSKPVERVIYPDGVESTKQPGDQGYWCVENCP